MSTEQVCNSYIMQVGVGHQALIPTIRFIEKGRPVIAAWCNLSLDQWAYTWGPWRCHQIQALLLLRVQQEGHDWTTTQVSSQSSG